MRFQVKPGMTDSPMQIIELHTLTSAQTADLVALMGELDPEIVVTGEMVLRAVESEGTYFFAAMDGDKIIGCASLCVFDSPTGRKASVEDVVVGSGFRGQGIGRALMAHIIDFASQELGDVDLHLTSRPERVAANELYRSLGFEKRGTNVYRLAVRDSESSLQ